MTRKQATRILAGVLSALSGVEEQRLRAGARQYLDLLDDGPGKRFSYNAMMLVDESVAKQLGGGAAVAATLRQEKFAALLRANVSRLANTGAKANFVGAMFILATLSGLGAQMKKSGGAGLNKAAIKYGAALASLAGALGETTGSALQATQWGATKLATRIKFLMGVFDTRAKAVTFGGKLIGSIAGMVSGALAIAEGLKETAFSPAYGRTMIVLGLASIGPVCGPIG